MLTHPTMVKLHFTFQDPLSLCKYSCIRFCVGVHHHHLPSSAICLFLLTFTTVVSYFQTSLLLPIYLLTYPPIHPFTSLHSSILPNCCIDYVLDLADAGELFTLIQSAKDGLPLSAARHFAAELVLALTYLRSKGIVHRDLKPENILVCTNGHIKLTDFATSKIVDTTADTASSTAERRNSFVGTADYVPPELLEDKPVSYATDMWALGCVVYQMLVGKPPFRGPSEYLTFQNIIGRKLSFPDTMDADAHDFIDKLLAREPEQRLGSVHVEELKTHAFFNGIDFDTLLTTTPHTEFKVPEAAARQRQLSSDEDEEDMNSAEPVHVHHISSASAPALINSNGAPAAPAAAGRPRITLHARTTSGNALLDAEIEQLNKKWAAFCLDDEKVLYRGTVIKHRGLFAKTRQLILTDMPRMIYINPENMELRGQIQWSDELVAELRSDSNFVIRTPKRTYHIKSLSCPPKQWVDAINQVQAKFKAMHGHS
jgi:3-phosphoinositide dependent protein kinase-1